MKISDTTINERRVFAHLDESELHDLLVKVVAKEGNFEIDRNTSVKVIISHKDRTGTAGFENYAEITLVNKLK